MQGDRIPVEGHGRVFDPVRRSARCRPTPWWPARAAGAGYQRLELADLEVGAARRIGLGLGADQDGREQFANARSANVRRQGGAKLDVLIHLAGSTQFPGFHQAAGGIGGNTASGIEGQIVDDLVLEDRDRRVPGSLPERCIRRRTGRSCPTSNTPEAPSCSGSRWLRCCSNRSSKPKATATLPAGEAPGQRARGGEREDLSGLAVERPGPRPRRCKRSALAIANAASLTVPSPNKHHVACSSASRPPGCSTGKPAALVVVPERVLGHGRAAGGAAHGRDRHIGSLRGCS